MWETRSSYSRLRLPLNSTHNSDVQSWHTSSVQVAWCFHACSLYVYLLIYGLSLYKVSNPRVVMCLLHAQYVPQFLHSSHKHYQASTICYAVGQTTEIQEPKTKALHLERLQASGEHRSIDPAQFKLARECQWEVWGLSRDLSQWRSCGVGGDETCPGNERSTWQYGTSEEPQCCGVNSPLAQATIISSLDPCITLPNSTPSPQSPR